MTLDEALANADRLCGVTAFDLKAQMHKVCQQELGKMAAKGLVHSNVTIVAIKDALNGLINEKAHQLIAQYSRILKATEIPDYKVLTDKLVAHARRHLDQHYSEGCHQMTINEQRILAGGTSPGIHLQGDYQRMLNWVEPQIRILVAELEKAASPRPSSAVAMSEDISSHGQSGGITAHTVNISPVSHSSPPERPRSKWKKVVAVVVAVVAFIASFVKVLDYFNVKPTSEPKAEMKSESKNEISPPMNPPQNTNVTSYNQSGGITAHTVNVGPQPRTVTPQFEQELIRVTTGYKKVTVACVLGDGEAFQFAAAITNYLKAKGRDVEGVNQAVYTGPVFGQQMEPKGDTLNLIIGTRQ